MKIHNINGSELIGKYFKIQNLERVSSNWTFVNCKLKCKNEKHNCSNCGFYGTGHQDYLKIGDEVEIIHYNSEAELYILGLNDGTVSDSLSINDLKIMISNGELYDKTNNKTYNKKPKLFIDFDGVVCNSIKAYAKTYNELYCYSKEFKPAITENCNQWDLEDIAPLVKNPLDIFGSQMFFTNLEFMPCAKEALEKLSKQYELIICSIGSYDNISLKSMWIQVHLPFIKDSILIINNGCKMDKSIIDMASKDDNVKNIFIDDHEGNLFSSNANIKICFGKKYPWNKKWIDDNNLWIKCWLGIEELLLGNRNV